MTRTEIAHQRVFFDIAAERDRQDKTWGEQNHADASPIILDRLKLTDGHGSVMAVAQRLAEEYEVPTAHRARFGCKQERQAQASTWFGIALEEVSESLEAVALATANDHYEPLREELVQTTAVFVAWIEALDRRQRRVEVVRGQRLAITALNPVAAGSIVTALAASGYDQPYRDGVEVSFRRGDRSWLDVKHAVQGMADAKLVDRVDASLFLASLPMDLNGSAW